MITSRHNPRIKWVRSLQEYSSARRQEGLFVVEGVRLAEEALHAGWRARLAIHTADLSERGQRVVQAFAEQATPVETVTPAVMRAASDTETPQGLLIVLERQALPLPAELDFALILDGLRDPGNLGTILRTAVAAGTQAVLLPPGSVDAFAPKVLRSGMGAHFRLPVHQLGWDEIHALVGRLHVYLAAVESNMPYTKADLRQPLALIIGGEAEGASPAAKALATARLHIPMLGGVESLNAAVAAGVLLFEAARQRAMPSPQ